MIGVPKDGDDGLEEDSKKLKKKFFTPKSL